MGNNRIFFIDQLKGLAMLAVVFNHLLQFCFGVNYTTTNTMLAIFDLPLFFSFLAISVTRKEFLM